MIRSIDYMFATQEFSSLLKKIEQPSSAIFYHLLKVKRKVSLPLLDAGEKERFSGLVKSALFDELRMEEGKLYFLTLLQGSGFIAQKLIDDFDENFVVTFLAGALSINEEEQNISHSPDAIVSMGEFILAHFEKVAQELQRYGGNEVQAYHDLILFGISNPKRLLNIDMFKDVVVSQGTRKSWVTQHLVDGYMDCKRISKHLAKLAKGEGQVVPRFDALSGYGLLLGLNTLIRFETTGGMIDAPLNLAYFLDAFYGQSHLLSIDDFFEAWLRDNGIEAKNIICTAPYPNELNIAYKKQKDLSEQDIHTQLLAFMVQRFSIYYEITGIFFKLLVLNTEFNIEKYPLFQPWKRTFRLVLTRESLNILPIMEAIDEDGLEFLSELGFRNPIVDWGSRMRHSSQNQDRPQSNLRIIENVSSENREIIQDVFFEKIQVEIEDYQKYPKNIFILRSKKEMKEKLKNLGSLEIDSLSTLDFSNYLESMGSSDFKKNSDGINGLKKAVEIHSLLHWRLASKSDFVWPIYYPQVLE